MNIKTALFRMFICLLLFFSIAIASQDISQRNNAIEAGGKNSTNRENSAEIIQVRKGSLAEKMGLKAGDRILEVNGFPVVNPEQVARLVQRALKSNTEIVLKVRRGNEIFYFKASPPFGSEETLGITLGLNTDQGTADSQKPATGNNLKIDERALETYNSEKERIFTKLQARQNEIESFRGSLRDYLLKGWNMLNTAETYEEIRFVAELWEKAKRFYPQSNELSYNLTLLYDFLEDYERAVAEARKITGPEKEELRDVMLKNSERLARVGELWNTIIRGQFTLLSQPQEKPASVFQDMKFIRKDDKIWMVNPAARILKNLARGSYRSSLERGLNLEPLIPIHQKGRFFEIRWFDLLISEDPPYSLIYTYHLIEGEFILDSPKPIVRMRYFSFLDTIKTAPSPSEDVWVAWERERSRGISKLQGMIFRKNTDTFKDEILLELYQ